ncbi:hypothetical protein BX666DRAFT_1848480 [Dichotomocladium elegans]|nr:hypothetical protein BX666DRAFT_1848480 [Dichotomocladium elegans]
MDNGPPTPLETSSVDSEPIYSLQSFFSKFGIFYTDVGISMETRLSSVSDLRTLIDAFSKLCTQPDSPALYSPMSPMSPATPMRNPVGAPSAGGVVLHRNKQFRSKPVNLHRGMAGRLSGRPRICLRQIADHCIHSFFSCWERYPPVLAKKEFMEWYNSHPSPTDTLIVNAICAFVFRHMVIYHSFHPDLEEDQEAFFIDRARELLSQSFDCPDRHTVVALLLMSRRGEPSKRYHYAGMAMAFLHELNIYPRMTSDTENDDFDKEMDTRLWWFAWAIDFSLSSTGMPKNTPQTRILGQTAASRSVDLPRVLEQDIDESEMAVLAYEHCYALWKIQSDIVEQLYDDDSAKLTADQLHAFDQELLQIYMHLPPYLRLDSGFEYGHQELFLVCLRVNVEYNATRIILLKLFLPDPDDLNPSPFSLEILNLCLSTALHQLKALNTYFSIPSNTCFFDRDELWRASEVITIAMDIYRNTRSPIILQNIDMDEYSHGLETALRILRLSPDYAMRRKNWMLHEAWLESEIKRHGITTIENNHHIYTKNQREHSSTNYFSANLKPSSPSRPSSPLYIKPSLSSIINLQQQQQQQQQEHELPAPVPVPAPPAAQQRHQYRHKQEQEQSPPSSLFVHFEPTNPPPTRKASISSSKSQQTRFRYFNPRKMNKFLFIDENPIL